MTSGERKALLFLSGIALLGVGTRAARTTAHAPTRAERDALATQLDAVDSARGAAKQRTTGSAPRRRAGRRGARGAVDVPPAAEMSAPPIVPPVIAAPSGPIDVDIADAATLDVLPGIGPAIAQRIVDERTARGPFGSLEGLARVRGIGPALAQRLAPHVTFSGVSRLPGASGTHVRRRAARR